MESGIRAGGIGEVAGDVSSRHFVPLQIGTATVFVEQAPGSIDVDLSGEIHPVALPSPKEAIEQAANFLQELVGIFDKRIKALAKRPEEVSVELALGFQVKGKATLIPVLLSGETTAQAGIKVSAKWGATEPT